MYIRKVPEQGRARVRGSDALLLWVRGPLEARLEEALGDGGAFPGGTALAGTVRVPGAGGPGARGALTRLVYAQVVQRHARPPYLLPAAAATALLAEGRRQRRGLAELAWHGGVVGGCVWFCV